jgi:hypothetical protein
LGDWENSGITRCFALFRLFSWSRHRKYTDGYAIGSGLGEGYACQGRITNRKFCQFNK